MISLRREFHSRSNVAVVGSRPLYAIGDVHGCYDLLLALLDAIQHDAAERSSAQTPLVIMCGDYVDRGPFSSHVLTALAWLKRSDALEVRLLEGNHEAALKMFLDFPSDNEEWLLYGGRQTLESYGIEVPVSPGNAALAVLRDKLLDTMPASHHILLNELELLIEIGDYAFAHAGVRPGVSLARQDRQDLLWIREPFLDHPHPSTSVIVHGHTWSNDQPVIMPHRIGIDTGAYETGVLTGLRIAKDGVETIQAVRCVP